MTRTGLSVIFALIAYVALPAFAGQPEPAAVLDRLMERSGLNTQITQLPLQIELGMAQANAGGELPPEEAAALDRLVKQVFTAESLHSEIRQHLSENLDRRTIETVLAWLESPLGRKITALEEAASMPEAMTEMQQQAAGLAGDEARVRDVQRLDAAIGATDAALSMSTNVAIAVALPMVMSLPVEQQPSMELLISTINEQSELQRASVGPTVLMSFLYTYRTLSDSELDSYIAFAESQAGRRYHSTALAAFDHAFVAHGRRLGERFADMQQIVQQGI